MSDLAGFLLQRIAEDERAVRYASVNAHRPSLHLDTDGYPVMDPARVLAECEAKRRIVDLHYDRGLDRGCGQCETEAAGSDGFAWVVADDWPCETLRLLALPYADHPDYREEWRA